MQNPITHAIIVTHPNRDSFTLSVARQYQESVEALGDRVALRDVYQAGFDPRLQDTGSSSAFWLISKSSMRADDRCLTTDFNSS